MSTKPHTGFRLSAAILALSIALAACAGSYGTLEGVVVEDEAVAGADIRGIEIIRNDQIIPAELNMILRKDDEIVTGADTRAVLHVLDDAYEVTLGPATDVVLENPSIFVKIGKVFYEIRKQLEEIREELEVESEFTTAGAEGTAFLFSVAPDDEVEVAVLEGIVRVSPKADTLWAPVVYGPREWGIIRGTRPPERLPEMTPDEVESQIGWAREVELLTTVQVPSVMGMLEREARNALTEERLEIGSVRYQITGNAEAGAVISQEPPGGSAHRVGDPVDLVIEEASVEIPNVTDRSLEQAERLLRRAGLELGTVTELPQEGSGDVVLSQDPRAGRRVELGTRVELEVSVAGVRVPRLVNATRPEAARRLRAANLRVGETSEVRSRQRPGTVVQHQPTAGTLVPTGSAVDVAFARGCIVPDLEGLSERQAAARLSGQGYRLGNVTRLEAGDTVTFQRPAADTQLECNSTVDVTVGFAIIE